MILFLLVFDQFGIELGYIILESWFACQM